jgi:hypothetical protein
MSHNTLFERTTSHIVALCDAVAEFFSGLADLCFKTEQVIELPKNGLINSKPLYLSLMVLRYLFHLTLL